MTTEHRMVAFLVILVSFISSNDGSCPSQPCLQDKPKLGAQDNLVLSFLYDQYEKGSTDVVNLYKYICDLIKTCGNQISIKVLPGAIITKDANGDLICPEGFCYGDQEEACSGIAVPEYFTTCMDKVPADALQYCLDNQLQEANDILVANGQYRQNMKIPDCRLPAAVTFNDKYDLCGNFNSFDDLKLYVCELYENSLGCCK